MQRECVRVIEAVVRILCDTPPPGIADTACLFAQSPDNERSVLERAAEMFREGLVQRLMVMDAPVNAGYAGMRAWGRWMEENGVNAERIVAVPLHDSMHNTLTEAEAFVRAARENGFTSLVVTAAPFHQVRAFMTMVHAGQAACPQIRFYSVPGSGQTWTQRVVHSQGCLVTTRRQLIHAELERIEAYGRKGDLVSYAEILEYMERREGVGKG
jgi:hypothetical protein